MNSISQRRMAALAIILSLTILHAWMTRSEDKVAAESQTSDNSWERTETLHPILSTEGTLSILNRNGNVTVARSKDEQLTVVVHKKVSPRRHSWLGGKKQSQGDAAMALDQLSVLISGDDEHPALETTELPKDSGFSGTVNYTVQLPKGAAADLATTNGHVRVTGVNNRVVANSTNGHIDVSHVAGTVSARTTNGKIDVAHVDGPVSAHTTNGGVHVQGIRQGLEASTTNGGITCLYAGTLADTATIQCSTTNGGISFQAAPESSFSLDAMTKHGRVRSEFPVTNTKIKKPNHLVGSVGTGGATVTLDTKNGSITVGRG